MSFFFFFEGVEGVASILGVYESVADFFRVPGLAVLLAI